MSLSTLLKSCWGAFEDAIKDAIEHTYDFAVLDAFEDIIKHAMEAIVYVIEAAMEANI